MQNQEIRFQAQLKGVKLWQVAERLGYSHESSFSRALRHELDDAQKEKILSIIDEISAEKQ